MRSSTTINTPTTDAPWREWKEVYRYVDLNWDPMQNAHHSIVGLTGSGKSYLVVNGILPMLEDDRVIIIDSKGDDPTLAGMGKPVTEFPHKMPWWQNQREKKKPRGQWYRLIVHDTRAKARVQVARALDSAYNEGNWVIVMDETRGVCDGQTPGLGLKAFAERIWQRGRSRRVSMIALTQAPRYVPGSFYDQSSFVWLGRLRDERAVKRLQEIGGLTRESYPMIANLGRREWFLCGDNGEYYARTIVKG